MATGKGKCLKKRRCSGSSFSSNSSSTDDATTAKRLKRQVQVSTFEKWQQELVKEHNTLRLWLCCERDRREWLLVSTLCCKVCREYEDKIIRYRNFSSAWINGSSNQRTSNIVI